MAAETTQRPETALAQRVARELVGDGYEVFLEPGAHLLPRGLSSFRPDILARRGEENLIVEIKAVPSPASAPQVEALARAVRKQPGWHFRLVTTAPEQPTSWSIEEATRRLQEAELLGRQHPGAALLLTFAVAEAVGRQAADAKGLKAQPWSPMALFRGLVQHGLLDRDGFRVLERASVRRNRLVHGLSDEAVSQEDVEELLDVAKSLIQELGSQQQRASAKS